MDAKKFGGIIYPRKKHTNYSAQDSKGQGEGLDVQGQDQARGLDSSCQGKLKITNQKT